MFGKVSSTGGGLTYVARNSQYGFGNWTWTLLPDSLQGKGLAGFSNDPADGGQALYATFSGVPLADGIPCSTDNGDTWPAPYCFAGAPNLTGSNGGIVFKDSSTAIVKRRGDLPLRTKDGGKTWQPMESLAPIAAGLTSVLWSWTGKTLAVVSHGNAQSDYHPHYAYVWRSTDDGDSWTDETDNIVVMGPGISQWYEDTLYLSSAGQGIMAKKFE